ncbi:MAG: hypothetical protein K0R19_3127 [Bacillota bacterium]|nr:hypothetical protein [Bacillota bacterium]
MQVRVAFAAGNLTSKDTGVKRKLVQMSINIIAKGVFRFIKYCTFIIRASMSLKSKAWTKTLIIYHCTYSINV